MAALFAFLFVQTDVFGEKAFEPVKMPVLALPGSAKVKGKQRNFKWSVKLQKEGQVILASGLGGPLTERAFVVDEADKVTKIAWNASRRFDVWCEAGRWQ